MSRHIVMLSGGVTSYLAAQRVRARGVEIVMLFADTLTEDEDLYRFLGDVETRLGPITRLADGRDVWDVFRDVRFLGNSRVDPCSRILKRELLREWLEAHCDPTDTTVYLGFNWDSAIAISSNATEMRYRDRLGDAGPAGRPRRSGPPGDSAQGRLLHAGVRLQQRPL